MSHHADEDTKKLLDQLDELKGVVGETGEFPDGKINEDDEGQIAFAIGVTPKGRIVMHFGKSLTWVGMTPDEAKSLAALLEYRAEQCEKGVTVQLPEGI